MEKEEHGPGLAQADSGLTEHFTMMNRPQDVESPRKRKKRRILVDSEDDSEKVEMRYTPWFENIPKREYASPFQRLHHEILAYTSYVQSTPSERAARQKVFSVLERIISRRFPGSEAKIFGSSVTGLDLPVGDMDIVVCRRSNDFENKKKILFQLSTALLSARITAEYQVIHWAKVPILTFKTLPEYGSFSVDISINNTDGIPGSLAVKDYLSKMPALRPLILVIKQFLSQRSLNKAATSGLSSYAATCMCISFLQLNPGKRPPEFLERPIESESLGHLLSDFLIYYGVDFPYETSYISVTQAKLLPKSEANWINSNPSGKLAIQCLVRPDNDIGKSAGRIATVREAFKEFYVGLLQTSVADENILRSFVSIKASTLTHRADIDDIVTSGALDVSCATFLPRHQLLDTDRYNKNRRQQNSRNSSSRNQSRNQYQYQNRNPYYRPLIDRIEPLPEGEDRKPWPLPKRPDPLPFPLKSAGNESRARPRRS